MTEQEPPERQRRWLVPTIGIAIPVLLTWLGVNDWRLPFVKKQSTGLTAPIEVTKLKDGAINIRWSVVDKPDLHGYDVDVTAVRPVEYEYGVPRYAGDRDVTQRHYPMEYLNQVLSETKDPRRVKAGQVWFVCVQGMKEMPAGPTPIDSYIIPGTKACSEEFTLP